MAFSGAVKIADLDDFIAPSQACVINLDTFKNTPPPSDFTEVNAVEVQAKPSTSGWSQTLPTRSEKDAVKISLQDCLACSGCVTSAETVLLEHQSVGELQERLQDSSHTVIVSLSQQSVASLAAAHNLELQPTARKLISFLKGLGVRAVFDIGVARELALAESATEFVQRHKRSRAEASDGNGNHATGEGSAVKVARPVKRQKADLPILASACPGWVCYAEKTHGEYALPYISTVKSPQAIMGSLIKGAWAEQHGLKPRAVYHCSVMPCYDKKLEASRDDFNVPGSSIAETDSVLTTGEVQQLLESRGVSLETLPEEPYDSVWTDHRKQEYCIASSGVSGGYMEHILRHAAKELFGMSIPEGPLQTRALRNSDFRETSLEVDGKTVLRFALAYGFRNIQTLLRKVKQGICPYDYVEIMACPSGCVNGGGQLKAGPGESPQEVIARVEGVYKTPQKEQATGPSSLQLPPSHSDSNWLHTQYHKREKTVTSMIKDW